MRWGFEYGGTLLTTERENYAYIIHHRSAVALRGLWLVTPEDGQEKYIRHSRDIGNTLRQRKETNTTQGVVRTTLICGKPCGDQGPLLAGITERSEERLGPLPLHFPNKGSNQHGCNLNY
jgi:hypothetical protein